MNSWLNEPSNPESPWAEAECGFDRNPDFFEPMGRSFVEGQNIFCVETSLDVSPQES